jgi:hypothetical protein
VRKNFGLPGFLGSCRAGRQAKSAQLDIGLVSMAS